MTRNQIPTGLRAATMRTHLLVIHANGHTGSK
jgi:hypothetical protein